MTDIITRAKRLLENATPAPWKWKTGEEEKFRHELSGADENPILRCSVMLWPDEPDEDLIAAAPEMAAVLAQETWEYSVQEEWITLEGRVWRMAADAEWHPSVRAANASIDPGTHSRIVRRRVSPPEVINE